MTNSSTSFADYAGLPYYPQNDPEALICGAPCRRMNPDEITQEEIANQILISPIPSGSKVQVEFKGDWMGVMEVFDIAGRKVISLTNVSPVQELDISGLNAGVYFLRRQTLTGEWVQKKFVRN
jgi:hypothetical protein